MSRAASSSPARRRPSVAAGLALTVVGVSVLAWQPFGAPGGSGSPLAGSSPQAAPSASPTPTEPPAPLYPLASPDKVRAALRPVLRDPVVREALGKRVVVRVSGLADEASLFTKGPDAFTPASTIKVLTSTAALSALGPETTFETTVQLQPTTAGQVSRLVLVGGGDPFLASSPQAPATVKGRADLTTLATATAQQLTARGISRVRVDRDTSLFSGPAENPTWRADYVPDGVVSKTVALWADKGLSDNGWSRVERPAEAATAVFARALGAAGITVVPGSAEVRTDSAATTLAVARSAPLSRIARRVIKVSDNEGAEVLLRHLGLHESGVGSTDAGLVALRNELTALGIDLTGWQQYDGSGLSRANLVRPETLLQTIRVAAAPTHSDLAAVVDGMPVVHRSKGRATGPGTARAKTGTLTGVHGLAGVATDAGGVPMAFVVAADRVDPSRRGDARAALARLAGALAQCRCGIEGDTTSASSSPTLTPTNAPSSTDAAVPAGAGS